MKDPTALSSRCTIQRRNGAFCDAPGTELLPFPVCSRHAEVIYQAVAAERMADEMAIRLERQRRAAEQAARHAPALPGPGLVYYLYFDGLIKIGHSIQLRTRLAAYPPQAQLLVTEAGPVTLERQRHKQFKAYLKARLEWFEPSAELWEHIRMLRGDVQDGAVWLDEMCSQM